VITESDAGGRFDAGLVWWAQAEGLVGFLDAFEHTRDLRFLDAAERVWGFIERAVIDREGGDWRWRAEPGGAPAKALPKAHVWKGPYHNGPACMEVIARAGRRRGAI